MFDKTAGHDGLKAWAAANMHLSADTPARVRGAADSLIALGAPIYSHLAGEQGAWFFLAAFVRDDAGTPFADWYLETLNEAWHPDDLDKPVDERRLLNPSGIRTDVATALAEHGLYGKWLNPGQVGIYNA